MPKYKRIYKNGGIYFFTVNLLDRRSDLLVRQISDLHHSVCKVKQKYPFKVHGWVVLPEHMHCIWELPDDDSNYSLRWRLIKSDFSRCASKMKNDLQLV